MSAVARLRAAALPALAVVLVGGVLAVQVDHGGLHYGPLRPADSCVAPPATSVSTGIDALTEELVLTGLNIAACQLGMSREAFTLQLTESSTHTDAQINALRSGLLTAIDSLKSVGRLPKASQLTRQAVSESNLGGFQRAAIGAIPDSLIDSVLTTDDILRRTINDLDLRTLLTNINDRQKMTAQVDAAVMKAVEARLGDLL